ncbi:MAG: hypothetical protein RIC55_33390 [Pirellulaceae bacterium]
MPDPLAYLLTWSTYGTWLPGDRRGWIEFRHGWRLPDPVRRLEAAARMSETACRLDRRQREIVEWQVSETCGFRGWKLHAVNCRSNHVHVVVAADRKPELVRTQLKAWCTRRLMEFETNSGRGAAPAKIRKKWWAERGSQRYINDEVSLEAAILYVRDGQDRPRSHQPEA